MDACLSCFSSKRHQDDREPLLPKHQQPHTPQSAEQAEQPPTDEPLSKLADVLAALSAGKLPSQNQINNFLRRILNSNVLQETQDAQSRTTPEILRGNGPLSRRGRKVIQDVAHVIEAFLQFGMEKNDDDLLQDLFFQLSQIETDESPISLEASSETSAKVNQMKEQAGKVKKGSQKHVPDKSEVSQDARTIVEAFKSLFTTFLTSSVFRLIISDTISIGRELVAHAASDVSNAALHVHDIAEDVEHKAEEDNFGRKSGSQEEVDLKEMAISLIEEGEATASNTSRDAKETIKEKKKAWEEHVMEAEDEVKRTLLARIQELVVRAQEDPSSRRAIIAILQIIRKYAHKFALASQETVESVREAVAGPSSEKPQHGGSGEGTPTGFADPTSYPPQPYGPPPPKVLIPGIEIDSPQLQYVLRDAKTMLERLAQGHKVDGIIQAFGDMVKHSFAVPRDLGKNFEKLAQEKLHHHQGDDSSSIETTKHTEHTYRRWMDDSPPGPSESFEDDHETEERANLFSMYFSSVGQYLDRALTRPGWATSEAGKKSLETLYDATQELLCVAGEVAADAEDIVKEGIDRSKNLEKSEQDLREAEEGHSRQKKGADKGEKTTISAEEKAKEDVHRVTDQWDSDIAKFLRQLGQYIDAVERDRTTMKLAHALEQLRKDTEDLFGAGREEMSKAAGKFKAKFKQRARASGTGKLGLYTQWLGWALPRLLHLLPLGAISVPRVEVQTDNVECAIDALWIRALASKSAQPSGRYGAVSEPEEGVAAGEFQRHNEGINGIGGKLVPDEVLMRQWTEMKVSFAEGLGAAAVGANDAQYRMGLAGGPRNKAVPGIEATSRMRVKMDGIKACARGMGYYFKYTGSLLEYEDEGVLSIDLGTAKGGGRHSGLSLDIELEMDKGDIEMDLHAANALTSIPILVIEDVDTTDSDSDLDPNIPQNFDVQEAICGAGHPSRQHGPLHGYHSASGRPSGLDALTTGYTGPSKLSIDLALTSIIPLFRVLNIQVDVRGVKFKIDKSRHWMFNKLVVEPFAGSLIRTATKRTLEKRVRKALEAMASGMALIMMEAKERAAGRCVRYFSLREGRELRRDEYNSGYEYGEEEEEEDGEMKFSDFYSALLERGPEIFTYYTGGDLPSQRQRSQRGKSIHTETHTELTGRGVVFTKQTHKHIQHQPVPSNSMVIPPPGLLSNDEENAEDFDLLRQREREWTDREQEMRREENDEQSSEDEQVRVAVGTGAQLFPGKGGPYGVSKDTQGPGKTLMQEVREDVEQVRGEAQERYESVKGRAEEGYENVNKGKERLVERRERERAGGIMDWRSSAFDF